MIEVGQAAVIADFEHAEDVLQPDAELHVGRGAEGVRSVGEEHEAVGLVRVVAVAEAAPDAADGGYLTQPEEVDERNAVQDPAFEVIAGVEGDVAVGHELHRVHEVEGFGLDGDGLVRVRSDEQWEGHLVPDDAAAQGGVDVTEGGEPDAFADASLGAVVAVVAAQDAAETDLMREAEDGGVFAEVEDGALAQATVIGALAGGEAELDAPLGGVVVL